MKVTGLTVDPSTNSFIVILKEASGDRAVPIWIGPMEAQAIAAQLENFVPPRPMTHDLLRNVIQTLRAKVVKAEVTELKDNTFYARVVIEHATGVENVDSRPSDAIALALRAGAGIFVHPDVVEAAQHNPAIDVEAIDPNERDRWMELLENLSPEAFGKYRQ